MGDQKNGRPRQFPAGAGRRARHERDAGSVGACSVGAEPEYGAGRHGDHAGDADAGADPAERARGGDVIEPRLVAAPGGIAVSGRRVVGLGVERRVVVRPRDQPDRDAAGEQREPARAQRDADDLARVRRAGGHRGEPRDREALVRAPLDLERGVVRLAAGRRVRQVVRAGIEVEVLHAVERHELLVDQQRVVHRRFLGEREREVPDERLVFREVLVGGVALRRHLVLDREAARAAEQLDRRRVLALLLVAQRDVQHAADRLGVVLQRLRELHAGLRLGALRLQLQRLLEQLVGVGAALGQVVGVCGAGCDEHD